MKFKHLKAIYSMLRAKAQTAKGFMQDQEKIYRPAYRVVNIHEDTDGGYNVVIQVIGKSINYTEKPEKLLADNNIVDLFSPQDVRNLTYLGYLGINSPKYKILAQQFLDDAGESVFAIAQKGKKDHTTVTANEISKNLEILEGLSQKDAHQIGFTSALEQTAIEKRQKNILLKEKP